LNDHRTSPTQRKVGVSVVDGTSRRHVIAFAPAQAQLTVNVDAVILDTEVVLERLARLIKLL